MTLDELYSPQNRFLDPLPIPDVLDPEDRNSHRSRYVVHLRRAQTQLHSKLPATTIWGYEGKYPGPTIQVRAGEKVRVEWRNEIEGTLPVIGVHAPTLPIPDTAPDADWKNAPQNVAGLNGVSPNPDTDPVHLCPYTVAHLHGGHTAAESDGWPESVSGSGQSSHTNYENRQRSTLLWYHDHAMGATRFNVYAGLEALYVIRDEEDDRVMEALHKTRPPLHRRDSVEVPLLIQDRNLNVDREGSLTGELVHKVEDAPLPDGSSGPMEFFGPVTLVNGKIWPHLAMDRLPYRLRVINGSNARTYRLVLVDEQGRTELQGLKYNNLVWQIGTDGGLLGDKVRLPEQGLVLASAERADLILELDRLPEEVQKLRWVNTAPAPFGNDETDTSRPLTDPSYHGRNPYPLVMEFRVRPPVPQAHQLQLPSPISPSFHRLSHKDLPKDHQHRLVALYEDTSTGLLTLNELEKIGPTYTPMGGERIFQIEFNLDPGPGESLHDLKQYRTIAIRFEDAVNFLVRQGSVEVWRFLNLTGDTHPIHVHLVQFQLLCDPAAPYREQYNTKAAQENDLTQPITFVDAQSPQHRIDDNELGWKDTVRVNPEEMVTIVARFDDYSGPYIYHCHILEHEDMEMMRRFVVLPDQLMKLMGMDTGHGMHMSSSAKS